MKLEQKIVFGDHMKYMLFMVIIPIGLLIAHFAALPSLHNTLFSLLYSFLP
jgi:hypothetical protein